MLMHTVAMCTSDQEADRGCHPQEFAVRSELSPGRGVGGSRPSASHRIQTFDNRRQFIVRPDQIRKGDWLRDLGTLRQVASVTVRDRPSCHDRSFVLRFTETPAVQHLSLSIPSTVETVTVWRAPIDADGGGGSV
ncbi:hypothetical protein KDK95_28390 [Actinospica sp. MGRD01-02]|uniref:Uncharacterized protein n=1 Tax=Actinospica acidithermotolerans TaxID=2828514 RepID=A0A941ECJ0_9ACTN|nr:hypothetical protein [Actinospica acidithermotolerans]MBR7830255.1 hypothetical protein [Actinospica acidithermotolerans]